MFKTLDEAMASKSHHEHVPVRGFYRVQLENEDGTFEPDAGWYENLVVNLGFNQYLVQTLGAIAGSKQISHMAVGSGGAPGATDTSLAGEAEVRAAVTAATSSSSKALQLTATFASANSFVTNTQNLSNIGLFNTSTAGAGTIFAGNTYASSAVATNQNLNATYVISFS